jgi:hypothetical protein
MGGRPCGLAVRRRIALSKVSDLGKVGFLHQF